MAADDRTFTEAEHLTLLTDRVQRETAALTAEKGQLETKLSEVQARVDVLEAEKAAATTERDKVTADFEAYKQDAEQKAAIVERQESRVTRVKAANESLPEDYFTDERTKRWAEMAEEIFESFVLDIAVVKPATAVVKETAAFTGGTAPTGTKPEGSAFGSFLSARHGAPVTAGGK